ncbi:RidA family protein [Alkaliphilus transvaalensis]|uniref:RidA family protein n=1 Tax=Alkaliphilus transvaalensis TaxID=114628 RepID=UPI00047D8649|nr:RidA family protein [Alkaliphilus transvaalensis]
MIKRTYSHCGDETCPACVVAGEYIYLAHHAGGHDREDIVYQMEASFNALKSTLESVGATLTDLVQINLYLRDIKDFRKARDVFYQFFDGDFPARTTITTEFVNPTCLCMIDGVAYKKTGVGKWN